MFTARVSSPHTIPSSHTDESHAMAARAMPVPHEHSVGTDTCDFFTDQMVAQRRTQRREGASRRLWTSPAAHTNHTVSSDILEQKKHPPSLTSRAHTAKRVVSTMHHKKWLSQRLLVRPRGGQCSAPDGGSGALSDQTSSCRHRAQKGSVRSDHLGEHDVVRCAGLCCSVVLRV